MRILIADDHPAYRDALELYVARDLPEAVIVSAASLAELDFLPASPPFDLVLLDWHLPDGEGGEGLARLAAVGIAAPVVVLSGDTDERAAFCALSQGARAFLPKTLPRAEIVAALRLVLAGGTSVPVDIAMRLALSGPLTLEQNGTAPAGQLTGREFEVLRQVATGKTNKEIGRLLGLQEVTVKLHTRRILRKLQAKNRTEAVVKARDAGLLITEPA
jgi:DNA-binding NarL/FixJ family response regulator